MIQHLKTVTKTACLTAWAVMMSVALTSCGGGGDEEVKTDDGKKPASDVEIEVKMEGTRYFVYEDIQYKAATQTFDTTYQYILMMPMHLVNRTGTELKGLVIGKGENGTSAHYCVGDNGQDFSSFLTMSISNGSDEHSHEVTMDLGKGEEKIIALSLLNYPSTTENSVDISLSVACDAYPLKTKFLQMKGITVNRKK